MHSATRSQGRGLAPCSDARPAQYLPTREKGPAKAGPLVPASGYPPSFALLAQLVEHLHGKEGVSGSSPEEGSAKARKAGLFPPGSIPFGSLHFLRIRTEMSLSTRTKENRRDSKNGKP